MARDVFGASSPTFLAHYVVGLARRIADDMEPEVAERVGEELVENLANQSAEAAAFGRMARDADESVIAEDDDEDGARV